MLAVNTKRIRIQGDGTELGGSGSAVLLLIQLLLKCLATLYPYIKLCSPAGGTGLSGEFFNLDLNSLEQSLLSIPLHHQIDLDEVEFCQ